VVRRASQEEEEVGNKKLMRVKEVMKPSGRESFIIN
jgi:hypothetical protein